MIQTGGKGQESHDEIARYHTSVSLVFSIL